METQVIQISKEQFDQLIQSISAPNVTSLVVNFLGIFAAAYSGYYFQKRVGKEKSKKELQHNAFKFNELVIQMGNLLENAFFIFDCYILSAIKAEKEMLVLMNTNAEPTSEPSFKIFQEFKTIEAEVFFSKIPDVGAHPKLIEIFCRMESAIDEFNKLSIDRTSLLYKMMEKRGAPVDKEIALRDIIDLHDRSIWMASKAEHILDASLRCLEILADIGTDLSKELKQKKVLNTTVIKIGRNAHYFNLLYEVSEFLNSYPQLKERLIYNKAAI